MSSQKAHLVTQVLQLLGQHRTKFIFSFLLLLAVACYWLAEPTTPARFGSLVLMSVIISYGFYAHRPDVIALTSVFLFILSFIVWINQAAQPIWLFVLGLVGLGALYWLLLCGRRQWPLFTLLLLAIAEVAILLQYVNIEITVQCLILLIPFSAVVQPVLFPRGHEMSERVSDR